MQSEPTLKKNKSGYYEVRWSEKLQDGTWRTRSISTRATDLPAAETFLEGWKVAARQAVQTTAYTFEALAEKYLSGGSSRITTDGQRCNLKWLVSHFGPLDGTQIDSHHITDYTQLRRLGVIGNKPAADSTIFKELTTLVTVLRYAAKNRLISTGDIPYVSKPSRGMPRDVWLDEKEEAEFLTMATQTSNGQTRMSRVHRFVWIALNTGARRQAIESLRWDHVDLAAGVIDFRKSSKSLSKKRRVAVPISNRLLPVLVQAHQEKISDFVLDSDSDIWEPYVRFVRGTKFEHIHPHDLRRTCGTLMARAGVPLWEICGVLGDSHEVAVRHYLHHQPGHLRSAVNRGAAIAAEGGESAGIRGQFVSDSPDRSGSNPLKSVG
jgi:integrase